MKFADIPKFTEAGHYQVNIPWRYLEKTLDDYINELHLQLNPDFLYLLWNLPNYFLQLNL